MKETLRARSSEKLHGLVGDYVKKKEGVTATKFKSAVFYAVAVLLQFMRDSCRRGSADHIFLSTEEVYFGLMAGKFSGLGEQKIVAEMALHLLDPHPWIRLSLVVVEALRRRTRYFDSRIPILKALKKGSREPFLFGFELRCWIVLAIKFTNVPLPFLYTTHLGAESHIDNVKWDKQTRAVIVPHNDHVEARPLYVRHWNQEKVGREPRILSVPLGPTISKYLHFYMNCCRVEKKPPPPRSSSSRRGSRLRQLKIVNVFVDGPRQGDWSRGHQKQLGRYLDLLGIENKWASGDATRRLNYKSQLMFLSRGTQYPGGDSLLPYNVPFVHSLGNMLKSHHFSTKLIYTIWDHWNRVERAQADLVTAYGNGAHFRLRNHDAPDPSSFTLD